MAKIAIVGAGRIGTAAAKLLLTLADHEIVFIDSDKDVLTTAFEKCVELPRAPHRIAFSPEVPVELYHAVGRAELEATLKRLRPQVVICAAPVSVDASVAEICSNLCHYIDFTEDQEIAAKINELDVTNFTFVPQTGLAPGLINYVGLSLFEELEEPKSLELRVGALPQVSFGPAHYAVTWSVEGLVNQYRKPTTRKVDGKIETVLPLEDLETIVLNGAHYEAFTTSGGIGNLDAYKHIPSVQYKTLRYPGHLSFLNKTKILASTANEAVTIAKQLFVKTRDDVVVLVAQAVDTSGMSASSELHFYPCEDLDLTAVELTTAGVGVAVVELLLADTLEKGVLHAGAIPFDALMSTAAAHFIFEYTG